MIDTDFEYFYGSAQSRVLRGLAVVCGDWDAAADATSEAFTRAFERWSRVSQMERPEGWVFRVGVNVLRQRQRRAFVERQILKRIARTAVTVVFESPPDLELWEAVRELPSRERQAVALRYVVGLAQSEIAGVMRVAPGTVAATLAHARHHLLVRLERQTEVLE